MYFSTISKAFDALTCLIYSRLRIEERESFRKLSPSGVDISSFASEEPAEEVVEETVEEYEEVYEEEASAEA